MDSYVTQVAWNKSGSTIAAAYGRFDHESWCTHKGALVTWSINRQSDSLTFATEVSSCLLSISFHPEIPLLIMGGTFNDDVIMTNESNEANCVLASSKMDELSHEEPLAQVAWIPSKRAGEYNVLGLLTV